jgi:hypothetical protein
MVTASNDKAARVWDAATGTPIEHRASLDTGVPQANTVCVLSCVSWSG